MIAMDDVKKGLTMDDIRAMAKDFVDTQAAQRSMPVQEYGSELAEAILMFKKIYGVDDVTEAQTKLTIDPKQAIQEDYILCAVCGKRYKIIPKGHLAWHGLTRDDYRRLCGYSSDQPLACNATRRVRSEQMTRLRLWELKNGGSDASSD